MKKTIIAFICLFLTLPCLARMIIVNADRSGEYPTIQAAIDASINGDTVFVADGIYTGEGNRDIDFKGKAITVKSENGPENCIIDCNGSIAKPHRGFYFDNGEDANSALDGFKIINGYASPEVVRYPHKLWPIGGAIYCADSNPAIKNCILIDNFAPEWGGGMYFENSSATIYNCRMTSNSAKEGGAVFALDSEPTFISCDFNKNWGTGQVGGAIVFEHGAPTIIDSNITNNSTEVSGGGIYCQHSNATITNSIFTGNSGGGIRVWGAIPIISNCTFRNNSGLYGAAIAARNSGIIIQNCLIENNSADYGAYGGGAICLYQSPAIYGLPNPIISNCIIRGNSTTSSGGAIYCKREISPLITNCLISGNTTSRTGGAIYCSRDCSPILNNCTIVGNKAGTSGGGIFSWSPELIVENSILADNIAQSGDQIALDYSDVNINYTNLQDGPGGISVGQDSTVNWGPGNIDEDPCFVEPGYWDTDGLWVEGDYHLLEYSNCINAGDPCYPYDPNETDLDGNSRIIDGRIDMGAYEFNPPIDAQMQFTPPALNCKSKANFIKAHITLPEDIWPQDIDVNTPATLEPAGLESDYIKVLGNDDGLVQLQIAFDRKDFCEYLNDGELIEFIEDGYLEVTVTGRLNTGRYFTATDTIKILNKN